MDLGALYSEHYGKTYSPKRPFAQAVCLFLRTDEVSDHVKYAASLKRDTTTVEMVRHKHTLGSSQSPSVPVDKLTIPVVDQAKRFKIEYLLKLAEENDFKFNFSGNRDEPYDQSVLDEIALAFNLKGLRYNVEYEDYSRCSIKGTPFTSHQLTLMFK